MKINGLVLAAGLSSRMGDFKPLMRLGEKSILEGAIDSLLAGGADRFTVVVGHQADRIRALLLEKYDSLKVSAAYNPHYARSDMLASIQVGLREFPPCDAFFLLPGDMPAIAPKTFLTLTQAMARTKSRVILPLLQGRRKHPPLICADCIPDILSFTGDGGLRQLWKRYGNNVAEIPVDDPGCGMDADTPEDYQLLCQYFRELNTRE